MRYPFLILFYSLFCFSQEEISSENFFWPYNYQLPQDGIIAAKNCFVRAESSTNSALLDTLKIGDSIKIIDQSKNNLNLNNLNLPWVSIEYKKKGALKKGYVWKGFIAIGNTSFKNLHFITCLSNQFKRKITDNGYTYDQNYFVFTIKLCDENFTLLAEKTFNRIVEENHTFTNTAIDNWGLKNISCIYRIAFNGEACGIPTEYNYFYWNGKKLDFLIEKYAVGDANAYYHTEELIFPKEKNGQPNCILKKISDAENTDENLEGSVFKIEETVEYYTWNGSKIKLLKKVKKKPFFKKYE